jgi:hypothetical protein
MLNYFKSQQINSQTIKKNTFYKTSVRVFFKECNEIKNVSRTHDLTHKRLNN